MSSLSQNPTSDIVIQQLRVTKGVGVGGGIAIVIAGGLFIWAANAISPGWPWFALGVLAIVFGVITTLRIPRSRVTLRDDKMIVYGQLWSRTIPRQSITAITPWPFVKWTDSRGRKRSTPVSILIAGGALPRFAEHAHQGRKALHKWAGVD